MHSTSADTVAADYYNSRDADQFYELVWGGQDIHIGLYDHADEEIATASERTVETLIKLAIPLPEGGVVVDLGSGYGGASRRLSRLSSRQVPLMWYFSSWGFRHLLEGAPVGWS